LGYPDRLAAPHANSRGVCAHIAGTLENLLERSDRKLRDAGPADEQRDQLLKEILDDDSHL
jgi:hypothetical protein